MQFLAPLWLALGAAAAVPLLLHLLRRRIGTRVPFPAARYLARAEQEHSTSLRLRNWLLMALRVLALLLLALAAARPVAAWRAGPRAPAAVAVVLDNSLSTAAVVDGRPVLDVLRDDALRALAAARADDRVWLVTADGRVASGAPDAVRAAVRAVQPLAGAGDLPGAVARAAVLAAGAGRPAPGVLVLTDGQATAWRRTANAERVRVVLVRARGAAPPNRAVVDVVARPARWSPAGELVARVSGGDAAAWQAVLTDSAGRTVASVRGTAAAGGVVRAALQPAARGWLAGAVRLAPDELRGDDERFVAVRVGDPPVVRADPSAGSFAAAAVAALRDAGRVRDGSGDDAVVVAEAAAGVRLPAVLVAPSDGARLGAANLALERLGVPWRVGAPVSGSARARLAPAAPGDSAPVVDVARRWRLLPRTTARADTLAAVGAEPWIVAGPNYILVASPLDPAWTSLPVRAAFVPWLGGAVAQRLRPEGVAREAAPGALLPVPPDVDALLGPRGVPAPVIARPLSVPSVPGVYFWLRGGARVGALVVNPEAEESQLARLNEAGLRARVRGRTVQVARDGVAAGRAAFDAAGAAPVGGPLLAAALALLAVEGLVTRQRRAAQRTSAAAPARAA